MDRNLVIQPEEVNRITSLGKALSSEARIEILRMLRDKTMSVNEIANAMNIPVSSAALHVTVLEDSGLILTEYQPGIRGSKKVCSLTCDTVSLFITPKSKTMPGEKTELISIPIGSYFDCSVMPTCGLISEQGYLGRDDMPSTFFSPARLEAQLLWIGNGYIEYRVPMTFEVRTHIQSIEISAEICSEAPNFRNEWKSDITLWINGHEIATYTSPGDFGDHRGKNNPSWWSDLYTQHGELVTFSVGEDSSSVNLQKTSDVGINNIGIGKDEYFTFRFGIKDDAENSGGMNIFGEKFGDYGQNILVRIKYL